MADAERTRYRVRHGAREFTFRTQQDDAVSRYLRSNETFYEGAFLETLERLVDPGSLVIDVGAHIGNHTVWFAGVMGCRVLAFEPNPASHDLLVANVADNDLGGLVSVVRAAASDTAGTGRLSPQSPDDAGTMALTTEGQPGQDAEDVTMTRIDDVLADTGGIIDDRPVALVKVDVEGHELEALRGASATLARDHPIVTTEVQSVEFFEALATEMASMGYGPVAVMNPTPTIVWWPRDVAASVDTPPDFLTVDSMAYAIRASMTANDRQVRINNLLAGTTSRRRHLLVITGRHDFIPTAIIRGGDHDVTRLRLAEPAGDTPRNDLAWLMHCLDFLNDRPRPDLALIAHDRRTWPVAQTLVNALEVPYVIAIGDQLVTPTAAWAYLNSALARWLMGDVTQVAWRSQLIFDCEPIGDEHTTVESAATRLQEWINGPSTQAALGDTPAPDDAEGPEPTRVLLVSYYMAPNASVAVNRLKYWRRQVPALADERGLDLTFDVMSTAGGADDREGHVLVPDRGLDHATGRPRAGLLREFRREEIDPLAATWTPYVLAEMARRPAYDVVIVSGNPFHYFDIAQALQGNAATRVILDYRDPFSKNPRVRYNTRQRAYLADREARDVAAADAVISVNQTCLDMVQGHATTRRAIVSNGYDETIVDHVTPAPRRPDSVVTEFVYSGKFYHPDHPTAFLDALDPGRHLLTHIGYLSQAAARCDEHPAGRHLGQMPYEDTIARLKSADVGVIFTSGDPFEHTTKIFDYLGCDLDIIVVTDGDPRTGEIHKLTATTERVHWVRNTPEELRQFLASFSPAGGRRPNRGDFSRRHQTLQLLDLIVDLSPD